MSKRRTVMQKMEAVMLIQLRIFSLVRESITFAKLTEPSKHCAAEIMVIVLAK